MSSYWTALTVASAAAVQWSNALIDSAPESWMLVAWGGALLAVGHAVRQHGRTRAPIGSGVELAQNRS